MPVRYCNGDNTNTTITYHLQSRLSQDSYSKMTIYSYFYFKVCGKISMEYVEINDVILF